MITRPEYEDGSRQALPDEDEVDPPDSESEAALLHDLDDAAARGPLRAGRVFGGGLKVKTTIDPELQAAAEEAIAGRLAGSGPTPRSWRSRTRPAR